MVSSRGLGDVYKRQIQVAGTEGSIRNLFATILNNEINDYEFFKTIGKLNQGLARSASDEQSYFLNLLDAQTLIICYQAVRSLKKKYFSSVPDGQLQQLIITLTTGVMRLQHERRVTYLRGINRDDFLKYQRIALALSLIHISEPTRRHHVSRMPSSA